MADPIDYVQSKGAVDALSTQYSIYTRQAVVNELGAKGARVVVEYIAEIASDAGIAVRLVLAQFAVGHPGGAGLAEVGGAVQQVLVAGAGGAV